MKSCHLMADTVDELHSMAKKIGLKRSWFQLGSRPHYDLVEKKRDKAVLNGAIELNDRKSLGEFLKRTMPVKD